MESTTVFLVDSQTLLREGIKSVLQNSPIQFCGESADPTDALRMLENGVKIDLILLEVPSDEKERSALLSAIRRASPTVKIVVLTANVDRWLLENATRGGISGVLQKNISAKALLYSLALVMLREKILPISEILSPPDSEDERPEMNGGGNDACHAESRDDLSPREIEILRHLANGLPNKAIARELDVAETTIKAHMKTILRKIKASNRTQAAIWSLTQGRSLNGRSQSDSELFNRELTSEAGLVSWKIAKADSGSHNSSTVRRLTSCAER